MPRLLAYRITVAAAQEDPAIGALWELGTLGVEIQPAAGRRLALLTYFPRTVTLDRVRAALAPLGATLEPAPIPEVDWLARFRETFRGSRVGRFVVAPRWSVPARLDHDQRLLVVDPGRAFGTGSHETTRLCLGAIESLFAERIPSRVLDLGTGSGILAIAAARLGARFVVASDNDPEAVLAACHHARLNEVVLSLVCDDAGAALRPRCFDLVVANITAPVLLAQASVIAGLLASSGTLILAGMLANEAAAVATAYAALGAPEERRDGEWSALSFSAP